jgi:hypothetical protein
MPQLKPTRRLLAVIALCLVAALAAPARAPAAEPRAPVDLWAYYYIWFNVSSWNRAKTDFPVLGRYSSDEPSIMREHIRLARQVGIDGFIVSWKSTPVLDPRLEQLVKVAEEERFKLGIIYQGLDFERRPLPIERITLDLSRFRRQFADSPVFDAFGKPLVVWSGTWEFSRKELETVAARHRGELRILASERNPDDYRPKAPIFEGNAYYWSSVDPRSYENYVHKLQAMADVVHDSGGLWLAPAAPGFDARLVGRPTVVDRAKGETLRRQLDAAQSSEPDAVALISWNEFSENTQVEPSNRHGTTALKVIADVEGATFEGEELDSSQPGPRGSGFGPLPATVAFIVVGLAVVWFIGKRRGPDAVA